MANTITVRTLLDSADMGIVHVYIKGDGATGDVTSSIMYNNSGATNPNPAWQVCDVMGNTVGFQARLNFDQTTPSPFIVITPGAAVNVCLQSHMGLNNPGGSGTTGNLTFSTTGLVTAGAEGWFLVKFTKKRSAIAV